ncbi:cation acetate symporter [Glycomyces algeriensis]|uniref:Cation acetate symporter n=1 Tax=Glycomyces algeriensis TaxID=256037 RepID=A0A9W6GCU7_9ACTN|nr:cation acetate symporter [Glycomyces algeriensis]MDA1366813.1 cation acetate symporter [Glycomyces algeriensis]MDA1368664.1 cation acetate symporter [Glycomyces algeriensis]MDR7351701.1 cation/acetate symporter [Glycomyces algeriensis]GLI44424.1 cation acetate symporter [Glycomyces algeriensis]
MDLLAQAEGTGRTLTMVLFLLTVAVTIVISIWGHRYTRTATDFHSGGRSFSAWQNGFAIASDYMSAASFLGIAGTIALFGYDGFLYSIGFLVAWLVALLLVAEMLRNTGRFTMADVLSFRMRQRPVRTAAAVSTLSVSIFYLLAQMVGAGALIALLLGIKEGETYLGMDAETAKIAGIVLVGLIMTLYVALGGMKGNTWVQIFQAMVLVGGAAVLTLMVLGQYGFNVSDLLGDAATASGQGAAFLEPGLRYGVEVPGDAVQTMWNKLDLVSLGLALVLGTAGLPHVLIRFYTVPDARVARRSINWGIGLIGAFYLMTLVLGFGAAAIVGVEAITAQNPAGNTAAPQLAEVVGGEVGGSTLGAVMLAVIASAAFAAILSTVSGLVIASSSSLAHDLYNSVIRHGKATEREEVGVAKLASIGIGIVAIVLAIFAQNLNVAFLVGLAFAVAASANLPTLLLSLFWKRFNTSGALWGIYGGLVASLALVVFSPVFSGTETSLLGEGVDIAWFPMSNPGLVSIPLGLICAVVGTLMSDESRPDRFATLQVRALTGAGSERAAEH